MIEFNGVKFAKNNKELVESLFHAGGTASGTYKHTARGTKLYKGNGELFAYVVHNDKQGYFVVSASLHNAKPFYMYGMNSLDAKYLGLDSLGYMAQYDAVKSFAKQFN